jgi:hypothetical protein
LHAVLVGRTDRKRSLYLAEKFRSDAGSCVSNDQEIIGMPTETLRLKTDFDNRAITQDRRDPADEQQCEPVGVNMMLE